MASQADIEAHYDVDNDFFALFLDEHYRAYSCGVWKHAQTLETAQEAKLDRLCQFAGVAPGHSVLDVGCGWGGLLKRVVEKFPLASAHGLTLSTQQFNYVEALSREQAGEISVELQPWNKHVVQRPYDAIVSIGAFEHFATYEEHLARQHRDVYRRFFDWCRAVSTPSAQVGLQTIVTTRKPSNRTEVRDLRYLVEKVFPGSAIPSISDIQAAIVDKYEVAAVRRIGLDYARTLSEWRQRLEQHKDAIVARYGAGLYEHYLVYFDSAKRCFESGYLDLFQVSLRPVEAPRSRT